MGEETQRVVDYIREGYWTIESERVVCASESRRNQDEKENAIEKVTEWREKSQRLDEIKALPSWIDNEMFRAEVEDILNDKKEGEINGPRQLR